MAEWRSVSAWQVRGPSGVFHPRAPGQGASVTPLACPRLRVHGDLTRLVVPVCRLVDLAGTALGDERIPNVVAAIAPILAQRHSGRSRDTPSVGLHGWSLVRLAFNVTRYILS